VTRNVTFSLNPIRTTHRPVGAHFARIANLESACLSPDVAEMLRKSQRDSRVVGAVVVIARALLSTSRGVALFRLSVLRRMGPRFLKTFPPLDPPGLSARSGCPNSPSSV